MTWRSCTVNLQKRRQEHLVPGIVQSSPCRLIQKRKWKPSSHCLPIQPQEVKHLPSPLPNNGSTSLKPDSSFFLLSGVHPFSREEQKVPGKEGRRGTKGCRMVESGEEKSQFQMGVGVFETPWEHRDSVWNFSKVLRSEMSLPSRHKDTLTRPRAKYHSHLHTSGCSFWLPGQEGWRGRERTQTTK